MSSGVKVEKECTEEYDKLKMKRLLKYIIYKLNDNKQKIIVDQVGTKEKTYEDMKQLLIAAKDARECRYAVFDLDFTFNDQPKNKVIFIAWSPEEATVGQKMIYTTSKDYIKKALQVTIECQATDLDEMSMDSLIERARRNMKD